MKHLVSLAALLGSTAGCGDDGADTGPPAIVSVTPAADGALWIHEPIAVTFSEPIDPATLDGAVIVTDDDGLWLAAELAVADDAASITVQVEPAARALGGLHLVLMGEIADPAGNRLEATELSWEAPAWEHAASGLDRGATGSTPALAATAAGEVVAAWATTDGIVVSQARAGRWAALGDALGTAGATAPAIAIDAAGRPVVVWSEPAALGAARWEDDRWVALASPGAGGAPVLASSPGGDPVIAFADDQAIAVRRLGGDAWEPVGGLDPVVGGGTPAIAAGAAGTVALAVLTVGAEQTIRVHVLQQGSWIEAPPLVAARPPDGAGAPRHAIAIGPDGIAVAWDEHSGHSWSVHVAEHTGDGWVRLGGALDVDPPAHARGAALAIDAAGAPVVAWTERIESHQRGLAARWNGTAWEPVGGDAWNLDPARALDAPALVLARGEVPVVGFRIAGDPPVIARFNGPAAPRVGLGARASTAGCALPDDSGLGMPVTLTDTGCFTIVDGRAVPAAGLVPFDITTELWSDGALKRRWLVVPDGQAILRAEGTGWSVPIGTMLVKEFAIETTPGDPSTRRPMETRFLIRRADATWQGYSFEWRSDFSNADLAPDGAGYTRAWPLSTGGTHVHSYPSRTECLTCHDDGVGFVLGVRTGQLARRFDYDGVVADQLATLEHIGLVQSAGSNSGEAFAAPHDPSETTYRRVRGYLAANCAHCHNPGGVRPTRDFRWETPIEETGICAVLVPGDPAGSLIHQRVSTRPGMPPLATLQTDPVIIGLLGAWITSLVSCP